MSFMSGKFTLRSSKSRSSSNAPVDTIISKIKQVSSSNPDNEHDFDSEKEFNADFQCEELIMNGKIVVARKVYLIPTSSYNVGWIVDCDVDCCMVCYTKFQFTVFRHHCRACGFLVCDKCSPYKAKIPALREALGSRVCVNCFGLKSHNLIFFDSTAPSSPEHGNLTSVNSGSTSTSPVNNWRSSSTPENKQLDEYPLAFASFDMSQKVVNNQDKNNESFTSETLRASVDSTIEREDVIDPSLPWDHEARSSFPEGGGDTEVASTDTVVAELRDMMQHAEHQAIDVAPEVVGGNTSASGNPSSEQNDTSIYAKPPGASATLTSYSSQDSLENMFDSNAWKMQYVEEFQYSTGAEDQTLDQSDACERSYRTMRQLIPHDVDKLSIADMIDRGLPRKLVERIWQRKVLWLLCMHPNDIAKIHIADLRFKYDTQGLDLVEMRALWHVLKQVQWASSTSATAAVLPSLAEQAASVTVDKLVWRGSLKTKLDLYTVREAAGKLSASETRHKAYLGCEALKLFDPDLPIAARFPGSNVSFKQHRHSSPLATGSSSSRYGRYGDSRIIQESPDSDLGDSMVDLVGIYPDSLGAQERSPLPMHMSEALQVIMNETSVTGDVTHTTTTGAHVSLQVVAAAMRPAPVNRWRRTSSSGLQDRVEYESKTTIVNKASDETGAEDVVGVNTQESPQSFDDDEEDDPTYMSLDLIQLDSLGEKSRLSRRRNRLVLDENESDESTVGDAEIEVESKQEADDNVVEPLVDVSTRCVYSADSTVLLVGSLSSLYTLPAEEALENVRTLVTDLSADPNGVMPDGKRILSAIFDRAEVGKFLISCGADPLLPFDSALSADSKNIGSILRQSIRHGCSWMIDAFVETAQARQLLHLSAEELPDNMWKVREYATCLILAGCASKALEVSEHYLNLFSPDDADVIYASCKGNFERMREPVETFELLEMLGANVG